MMFMFAISSIIDLKGDTIYLNTNEKYEEPGYEAKLLFLDLTDNIKTKGKVDTTKPGTYKLTYSLKILVFSINKNRKVIVQDLERPVITLKGEGEVTICPNSEYKEDGYEAYDKIDGDLTNNVKVEKTKDKIIYTVSDKSNNESKLERKIKYEDTTKPSITLSGSKILTIYKGDNYKDSGYKADDNCDGDITSSVKVSGSVNTNKTGTYTITYIAKDKNGNEETQKRTVKVIERVKADGVIYLTFDDGPSRSITPGVLDILKAENVKATFFVINHDDSLNYLIKRAYNEGHTVALHSYTHNYKNIYASSEAYFDDLNKIREKVYKITGEYSNIIRFPGGSSNTVSKFNPKIMTTLAKQTKEKGFIYYDWNISSGDAGGARTSDDVYRNVTKYLKNGSNIVLLHDKENNYMTLNSLKRIIEYGKKSGYTFDKITESTPPAHHKINN